MTKDPKRWDDPIIRTPSITLTKRDVHDYYTNDAVTHRLLNAVGNREVVIRQSFKPGQDVLRRKDDQGKLIRLTPGKLQEWAGKRLSEVHPTFGKRVDFLLADVDPRERVPWADTKAITETVAKTMAQHPKVKDVKLRFSGGRGFYVKGRLGKAISVDQARDLTKKILDGITKRPDVTFGVPESTQIRLDTTPLKYRGSVRAPFSLNAQTGLVSSPVKLTDLPGVERSDFTIGKMIKKAASKREFAPGIPAARTIDPIPTSKGRSTWNMAIQRHQALKAGKHLDLRLVDPKTQKAHSFAVPRARLPKPKDRMLLALHQPTHTADYALKFTGTIPKGTYGAGKVTMAIKPEKIQMLSTSPDRIQFKRPDGTEYVLFHTKGNKWGFKRKKE